MPYSSSIPAWDPTLNGGKGGLHAEKLEEVSYIFIFIDFILFVYVYISIEIRRQGRPARGETRGGDKDMDICI